MCEKSEVHSWIFMYRPKTMMVVHSSVLRKILSHPLSTRQRFLRYQPTFFRTEDTYHTSSNDASITTPEAVLPTRSPTMDTPDTLAPVSSLPFHVQEQIIKATQKFLNCVAVVDTDPSPLVNGTGAKVVEEGTMQIVPVPKATTIDPFAIGREPIKIGNDLYCKVLEELKRGIVPPIYHALVKGRPCVAFKSNAKIIPSSEKVIAGNVPKDIEQRLVGVPRICGSLSDIRWHIGMDAYDLDSAVNANGVPYPILSDGSEGTWDYDHESAIAAADLVNQGAEMKGYGVEITPLTDTFTIEIRCKEDPPSHLITRPESRGVVMSCFDRTYTSAFVGSPGIGKSYNLLLEDCDERTVVDDSDRRQINDECVEGGH
jgi:hypothetical protein